MTARQTAVAAAADVKWLTNSAAVLRRRLRYDAEAARWWGLVRLLDELGLTLKAAAAVATSVLGAGGRRARQTTDSAAGPARIEIELSRYESIFLANLSRALNHETPRRRGRIKAVGGDAIAAASHYGVDIGLLQASLARTPTERLALLERNAEFLGAVRRTK